MSTAVAAVLAVRTPALGTRSEPGRSKLIAPRAIRCVGRTSSWPCRSVGTVRFESPGVTPVVPCRARVVDRRLGLGGYGPRSSTQWRRGGVPSSGVTAVTKVWAELQSGWCPRARARKAEFRLSGSLWRRRAWVAWRQVVGLLHRRRYSWRRSGRADHRAADVLDDREASARLVCLLAWRHPNSDAGRVHELGCRPLGRVSPVVREPHRDSARPGETDPPRCGCWFADPSLRALAPASSKPRVRNNRRTAGFAESPGRLSVLFNQQLGHHLGAFGGLRVACGSANDRSFHQDVPGTCERLGGA